MTPLWIITYEVFPMYYVQIGVIFEPSLKKCCLKIKDLQMENLWLKNIYFLHHTLMHRKSRSWNGKSTVRTSCAVNFRSVLETFNIYFDDLICMYSIPFGSTWNFWLILKYWKINLRYFYSHDNLVVILGNWLVEA